MRTAVRGVRAAFVFLTRVPLGGHPYATAEWTWAPAHFPLVGLVLGGLLAAIHRLLRPVGALPDATLVIAASLLLTGAMHEDGFADTTDALGGAVERARILELLKDSRIGTFGACALIVSLVGRVSLLARLGPEATWALPLIGCAARVAPVWQMVALPYVSRPGTKSEHLTGVRPLQAAVATTWLVLVLGAAVALGRASATRALVLLSVLGAITATTSWRYSRRVGGFTGDFLGATEQLCELGGYAVLAWRT
jgi:adenosylcobinamide-GDP ribazoletransferase